MKHLTIENVYGVLGDILYDVPNQRMIFTFRK